MKKLLLAAAAVVALSVQAGAADIPLKTPYRPPPIPVLYNWTGCYLGIHAGGGIHHSDFTSGPEQGGNIGVVAGGQAGCNYQIRQLVVGIEGELYWTNLEAKSDFINIGQESHDRARNLGDANIALRLGYAFDRLLFYGKVGANWGKLRWTSQEINFPGVGCECSTEFSGQSTQAGLLIGVGWEYAFLDNWTVKMEYDYINFGNPLINFALVSCTTLVPFANRCEDQTGFSETVRDTKHIFKVGINYKFDVGKAPVVARY
jgi:outer membrane immunogenic protein